MKLLMFVITLLVAACGSMPQKQPAVHALEDTVSLKELYVTDPVAATLLFLKTVYRGVDVVDTYFYAFEGEANSRLYYLKVGHVFNPQDTAALALYSVTDTSAICVAYHCVNGTWVATSESELYVQRFNSIDFRVDYDDFNFDGYADVFVNFFTTSIGQDVGYMLTYDAANRRMRLLPETMEMTAPAADAEHKTVRAKGINAMTGKWFINEYRWINDTLRLFGNQMPSEK